MTKRRSDYIRFANSVFIAIDPAPVTVFLAKLTPDTL